MTSEVENIDCMIGMARYPDKFFDLAVVDPPYGIGMDWKKRTNNRRNGFKDTSYQNTPVGQEYFNEIKRVSVDWVIWGWNYYTEFLGSSNYLICWDKQSADNPVFYYSQFELAIASKKVPAKIISISWDGYRMGKETGVDKIHPHQKPIALYDWVYKNYLPNGGKVLDTHLGSGSNRIAADKAGNIDFVGFELDKDYFDAQEKRWRNYKAQLTIF